MSAVTLRNVSKTYEGDVKAVRGIDLEIGDGEFVVLVGPSGCGKTTTLRMIAGLEDVSEGSIRIGEREVTRIAPKDRNIAMVFQNYALYPHMNVYRNMAFGLELRYRGDWLSRLWLTATRPKMSAEMAELRKTIRPRVEQTAAMLGISHLLDRKPGQLSGGEKQRVALGRAIVRQPAAFLFDEPLSNLDARLRGEMRRELRRLHSDLKATMIYVTHDQVEAMTLGERIVVMNQGEVKQIGTPLEVYDRPADRFTASFLGSPPMNLLDGRMARSQNSYCPWAWLSKDIAWIGDLWSATEMFEGRKVTLGIRPEDLKLEIPEDKFDRIGFQGTVESVEPLGDATVINVRMNREQSEFVVLEEGDEELAREFEAMEREDALPRNATILTVKIRERMNLETGTRVRVLMEPSTFHWFDTETGKRIP